MLFDFSEEEEEKEEQTKGTYAAVVTFAYSQLCIYIINLYIIVSHSVCMCGCILWVHCVCAMQGCKHACMGV